MVSLEDGPAAEEGPYSVDIDASQCMGHGRCEVFAPDLFLVNDDGLAELVVDPPPPGRLGDALLAARNCPEAAITVHRQASN